MRGRMKAAHRFEPNKYQNDVFALRPRFLCQLRISNSESSEFGHRLTNPDQLRVPRQRLGHALSRAGSALLPVRPSCSISV
ncbi:hypothetical protein RRG08_026212 [Elysia crispata]|uniref:Uncharacterized protein n=1 Tax=Elysia crispata TaxID=231223 RepID=A0AAE0ZB85_9GAST|nr:hypothetical protein RRG08_026212 [Elysia crispata]